MSAYTPGPWVTKRDNHIDLGGVQFRIVWSESSHFDVAYCHPSADQSNGNGNARLIAAAPAMLEELKRIEIGLHNLCEMGLVRPVEETRKVAARVRGVIDLAEGHV